MFVNAKKILKIKNIYKEIKLTEHNINKKKKLKTDAEFKNTLLGKSSKNICVLVFVFTGKQQKQQN